MQFPEMKIDPTCTLTPYELHAKEESERLLMELEQSAASMNYIKQTSEQTLTEMLVCIESQNLIIEHNNREIKATQMQKLEINRINNNLENQIAQLRTEIDLLNDTHRSTIERHKMVVKQFHLEKNYLEDNMKFEQFDLMKKMEEQNEELTKMQKREFLQQIQNLNKSIEFLKRDFEEERLFAEKKIKNLEERIIDLQAEHWKGQSLKKVKFGMNQISVKIKGDAFGVQQSQYNDKLLRLRTSVTNFKKSIKDPGADFEIMQRAADKASQIIELTERPRNYSEHTSLKKPNRIVYIEKKENEDEEEYSSLKISEKTNNYNANRKYDSYKKSMDDEDTNLPFRFQRTERLSAQFTMKMPDFESGSEKVSSHSEVITKINFEDHGTGFDQNEVERCHGFFCFVRCLFWAIIASYFGRWKNDSLTI